MPRHSSSRSSRSRSVIRKRKHHKRSTSSSSSSANSDRRRSSHYRRRSRSNEQKKSSKRSSQKPVEQQATHYNFRDTTIAAIAKTDSNPIQKVFLKPQISFGSEEVKQFRAKHYIFVRSSHQNVPDPIAKFDEVSCFPRAVVEQIQRAGFKAPTPIQSQGWSIALSGHDLIGIAQTGSGKTLAFLLPALVHIQNQHHRHSSEPQCLILAPTRELTLQIYEQFQKFTQGSHLYAACLYGGQEKYIQKNQLRRGAQILIACPGRLIDLIDTGHTTLKSITFLILDEADRMLDMGFEPQIRKIVGQIRPDRQTMLFSATWPKEVQKLALDFCHEQPVHIQIGNVELTSNRQIKQSVIVLKSNEKHMSVGMFIFLLLWEFSYRKQKDQQGRHQINKPIILRLLQILRDIGHKKILIFCATKKGCDVLQKGLEREGIRCLSIHGDKKQNERDYVMNNFRTGRATTLIATDVASRGLDIKDIEYVINFDMPKVIEDYVHRIGRTGRAGALGISISFFASDEDHRMAKELGEILKESNTEIPPELRQLMETSRHGGGSNSYNPYRRWNNNGQQSGGYNNNHRENNNSSGYNNNHHGGYNNNTNGYSGNNYNNGSSSYNHANSSNYPSSNQAHYLRSQPTVQPQQVWPSTTTTSYPIAAQVLPTAQSSWAYQPPAVPTTSSWENKGIYEMNQYQQFGLNPNKYKELLSGKRMAKFQSDLLPMQNLDTFVDLSKPLHDLNTLQQKKVRSIIQHLKYQSQTKKILDQQQESKKNLFAISKQLEIELDSLNNLEAQEEQYEVLIDLVQLKYNPKEIGTMIKESSAVIDTHFNLNKIKQHIKSKSHLIQQNEQTNAQQFDLDFIRDINTDSQDFYKEVLQQTKRYSIQKVDEDKLTMNEKLTILKEYLKKKGIEIEKKEKVPHQAYLDFYTEQSNKLIKQTRNSQIQRLNLRKSLSICKNSPSDQSGMSPTLHQIHTNRVSKFGQNQIQLLNSQNITTNQTSTFQTKNRTPQSVKSPTHFKTQSTEKFRDFVAKAQALQSFYNLENKEYYDNINDLDHALKKPMRKHFNEFKLIEQEKEDLQQKEKHNKMVQRKRHNHVKSVRMLKIFKSELS